MAVAPPLVFGLAAEEFALLATALGFGYYEFLQMNKVPPVFPINSDMSNPGGNSGGELLSLHHPRKAPGINLEKRLRSLQKVLEEKRTL